MVEDGHNTVPTAMAMAPPAPTPTPTPTDSRRSTLQLFVVMSCLCAGAFVAALDVTIIATALPAIAAEFHSSAAYTWIGSAYILANTASIPVWGKLSDIWGRKPLLLAAMAVFFVGSLICSVGSTMTLFLLGRAVQGLGAAGLITLVNICVSDLFSLRDRGLYFGLISVAWAAASGVGPVLGGAFTEQASWRWCFWVNLPITGVVFLLLWFTLKLEIPKTPIWAGLKAVDWSGCLLVMGSSVMLLLGLDLGGVTYPWGSPTVVCLVVFGIVVLALFVLNEWKLVRYPVIPLVLFRYRSGIAAFLVCFCHGFVFLGEAYYLPLYFQAVLGASPLMSGVYLLPFVLTITLVAAATGLFIQRTGKYVPAVWLGLALTTVGVGLLVDLDVTTNWAKIVAFQIVSGAGVGMNFEGPLLALQAIVGVENTATATATIGFVRTISTAVSVVVGAVVFQNQMARQAPKLVRSLGEKLASELSGTSAFANVALVATLPPAQRAVARQALYESMRMMWIVYNAFAAFGFIAGFFVGAHHLSKEHKVASLGLQQDNTTRSSRSRCPEEQMEQMEQMEQNSVDLQPVDLGPR